MTAAMRKIYIFAALAATTLFAGCSREFHDLRPSEYGSGTAVGYLSPALQWELADDAGTAIHNLTIADASPKASFSKSFASAREMAEQIMQMPVGACDILACINLTDADGFNIAGTPATSVSLKNPVSSPAQAWFGVAHADIKKDRVSTASPKLQRLLSSLSVSMSDVPAGTKLAFTLSNVAKSINLVEKDANGRFGQPSADGAGDLAIANLTAGSSGTIEINSFTTLPTASTFARSILTIDVTPTSGPALTCVCDAPKMEAGKSYSLNLNFNTLQSYMHIGSVKINDWTDGWGLTGEIDNPQ